MQCRKHKYKIEFDHHSPEGNWTDHPANNRKVERLIELATDLKRQADEELERELEKIQRGENVDANLTLVEDLCEVMKDGSLCAMGGLTPMPVLSAIKLFPEDFDRAPAQAAE